MPLTIEDQHPEKLTGGAQQMDGNHANRALALHRPVAWLSGAERASRGRLGRVIASPQGSAGSLDPRPTEGRVRQGLDLPEWSSLNRLLAVRLYTVGHSNQTLPQLVCLLEKHGINAVADVRSMPFSRRLPQFNRPELEAEFPRHSIRYVFLGEELGARRDEAAAYDGLQAAYERVALLPAFQAGLERVLRGLDRGLTLSLLCAERDPLTCHRAILVSRHLQNRGVEVQHILGDGALESHQALEQRMRLALQKLGVLDDATVGVQLDLLGNAMPKLPTLTEAEEITEAYRQQGRRIAYTKPMIAA